MDDKSISFSHCPPSLPSQSPPSLEGPSLRPPVCACHPPDFPHPTYLPFGLCFLGPRDLQTHNQFLSFAAVFCLRVTLLHGRDFLLVSFSGIVARPSPCSAPRSLTLMLLDSVFKPLDFRMELQASRNH
eukprot:767880-Hanusia_phi.AAC.7